MAEKSIDKLDKFVTWANQGRRTIKVEVDNQHGRNDVLPAVWCYSYEVGMGTRVTLDDAPPTDKELRQLKIDGLKDEITELEKENENG